VDDPLVERLLALVRDELRLEAVTPEANLLMLGASSLDMLRVVDQVERHLGFRPKVEEFFRQPSIAGLADLHRRWRAGEAVAQDSVAPSAAAADDDGMALTPERREAAKRSESVVRRFGGGTRRVALPLRPPSDAEAAAYVARRSYRAFDPAPLPLAALAATLAPLRQFDAGDGPRRLYASAGGVYAVQTYLHVKAGRVEGLPPGAYYFDPTSPALALISEGAALDDELHVPYNQHVARAAAFTVCLVAAMDPMRALYADLAERLVHVEAGLMTELLDLTGPGHGVGFCHLGSMAFEPLRAAFALEPQHALVHLLAGGAIPGAVRAGAADDPLDLDTGTV
jgi:SagB-type dehydrogenase family enzyme